MLLHANILVLALFLLCLNGSGQELYAQRRYTDTFHLTMADKTPAHPYYGVGYHKGMVLDGVEGGTMILVRDSFYLFDWSDMTEELFPNFYTVPIGGGRNFYTEVVNEWIPPKQLIELRAKKIDKGPDTLYYASTRQPWVGGMILVVDSLPKPPTTSAPFTTPFFDRKSRIHPNPVNERARISFTLAESSAIRWEVLDLLGRQVLSGEASGFITGVNELPINALNLMPGLYLYRLFANEREETVQMNGQFRVLR